MLSNVIKSYLLNVVSLLCVGWFLYDFLSLNIQFSEVMTDPEPPWEITMSIGSFASLIVLLIVSFFYYRARKKTKNVSPLLFPFEFALSCPSCAFAGWKVAVGKESINARNTAGKTPGKTPGKT